MIVFDLVCPHAHRFEGWFANSTDFEEQLAKGQVSCPVCGSAELKRAVTASHVARGAGRREPAPGTAAEQEGQSAARELLRRVWEQIHHSSEYVGKDFAREARRMHQGEADSRTIHGEATREEAEALLEEGLAVVPLGPAIDDPGNKTH
ncbi:MAG TPA: DUF1178 family protein [Gammaproteobacteria bacterium]|nr:DUF1178 family protein [Gammaproteobacteria bacterium]